MRMISSSRCVRTHSMSRGLCPKNLHPYLEMFPRFECSLQTCLELLTTKYSRGTLRIPQNSRDLHNKLFQTEFYSRKDRCEIWKQIPIKNMMMKKNKREAQINLNILKNPETGEKADDCLQVFMSPKIQKRPSTCAKATQKEANIQQTEKVPRKSAENINSLQKSFSEANIPIVHKRGKSKPIIKEFKNLSRMRKQQGNMNFRKYLKKIKSQHKKSRVIKSMNQTGFNTCLKLKVKKSISPCNIVRESHGHCKQVFSRDITGLSTQELFNDIFCYSKP
ncbi:unnamed protein product [Moneuplotes crassus]|uniref:Uncharacterized protein n=1 Tax=Euplotes crassus TaxID=5936 RepID=A0AAD1UDJ9_EUPCR|nr:unnamed protein product [Moneuplotes crassus]